MTEGTLRWSTDRSGEVTLAGIRAFIEEVARDLDPDSRYISELLAAVDASRDVGDYMSRLMDPTRVERFQQDGSAASGGERGRSWLDAQTWAEMDPYEQTLSNLLTGETRMMWAGDGAADFALLGEVLARLDLPRRVLSIPCSIGKEPFSIAIAALQAGLEVQVLGVDRQDAYLERARSGTLVPHHRDLEHDGLERYLSRGDDGRVRVSGEVLACCRFEQGDVLTGALPQGPFALVSCRNLLGYFRGESLAAATDNVLARVRPGGALLLDPFVSEGREMAPVRERLSQAGFTRRQGGASYYDAPR